MKLMILRKTKLLRIPQSTKNMLQQACKLYNITYMIASARVTNAEIFAFMAVLVFKFRFQTGKTIVAIKKQATSTKKQQILQVNYWKIINT